MAQRFVPQPYPLYAVAVMKAENPPRFELVSDPFDLVIGWWVNDEDGTALPALGDARASKAWDGPVFYEESRERAEALAKWWNKSDRRSARDAEFMELFARFERWTERMGERVEQWGERYEQWLQESGRSGSPKS